MPIYEYKCDDCGTRFEKLVRRAVGRARNRVPVLRREAPARRSSPRSPRTPTARRSRRDAADVPGRAGLRQSRHVRDELASRIAAGLELRVA